MAFNNGHALVIGVGEYTERRLQTPRTGSQGEAITVSDARGVAGALTNPNVCAYPETQVTFLPDEQTTKAGMTKALKQLASRTGTDDTVVIFFCGHGSLGDDDEYYFGTRDVKLAGDRFKGGTGLSKKEFLDLLREVKAQKLLLIINACFSGNVGATLGLGEPEEEEATLGTQPPSDMKIQVLGTGEGRAIITASRSSQFSCFDKTAPNTFFGKALIDALQGKGMPAGEFIGLYDLYNAVYKNVKDAAATIARLQEPVLTIVDQVGPFPIALASGGGALGVLGFDESLQAPPENAAVEKISKAEVEKMKKTHGGINISGGNVSAGGDFVGGDKIVHGDEVHGDKVMGDKNTTGNINVGNITGSKGIAIGSGASSTYTETTGVSGQELATLFSAMHARVDARPEDPTVEKDELKVMVERIQEEAKKGNEANAGKLERWVKYLNDIAPDVIEVAATTLLHPVAGITLALKNIIAKAQQEKRQA